MANANTSTRDLHRQVTDQIIAAIEQNPGTFVLPWRQAAASGLPVNAVTKKPYNGINILTLWTAALSHGFVSPVWATYKQWTSLGAQVTKGERASLIVFVKDLPPAEANGADETSRHRRVARAAFVFNAAQVVGYR